MPTARGVRATNLLLDVVGFGVRLVAWSFFIWAPIYMPFVFFKLGAPWYSIPVEILICLCFGLVCRWFSDGIYKRRVGRMLVLACSCLLISGLSLIGLLFFPSGVTQKIAGVQQIILLASLASVLFVGVARRKTLAAQSS